MFPMERGSPLFLIVVTELVNWSEAKVFPYLATVGLLV